MRDYSKPVTLDLRGEKGFRTYVKIATSTKRKYDAKSAAERAAKKLRKQGINV